MPLPGYNIQSLFRVLPQHTVARRCTKALELPQNGFLRGNQGLPAVLFQMSLFTHRVIRMVYLFENNIAVSITYSFPADRFDMGKQLADYSIDSFHVE